MHTPRKEQQVSSLLSHQEWLEGFARRLVGDGFLAEDLVQETWEAALKQPPDPERPAKPWLAGTIHNLARQHWRASKRRRVREHRPRTPAPPDQSPEIVDRVLVDQGLFQAVSNLPEPYRSTIRLCFFSGLGLQEIGAMVGVPVETVRSRRRRGLRKLREQMGVSRLPAAAAN